MSKLNSNERGNLDVRTLVRNLKSAWDQKPKESVPMRVQPIHVPVIKKKEAPQMRQRMHREPLNLDNVVRPAQAGVPERPDYIVNLKGLIH